MSESNLLEQFAAAARKVGAEVTPVADAEEAAAYIGQRAGGPVLLSPCAGAAALQLEELLRTAGCAVSQPERSTAATAAAGVTGANFALADTGTVVLESTAEAIRLASTLPERHFVLLDPRKILPDGLAAAEVLRRFHQEGPHNYLAYITGPSRTADIERVLTIGVHGPCELHILLIEGMSDDFMEL